MFSIVDWLVRQLTKPSFWLGFWVTGTAVVALVSWFVGRGSRPADFLTLSLLLAGSWTTYVIAVTMARYLRGDNERVQVFSERLSQFVSEQAAKQVRSILAEQEATGTERVSPTDMQTLIAASSERVLRDLPHEVISQVRLLFERQFGESAVLGQADGALRRVIDRLTSASEEVRKRANLNLIMGTITCAMGVVLLLFLVFVVPTPTRESWQETLVQALPRLSLVFIIELVGYFFLGLYRLGTYELKYFQNEITNVELWTASYLHAVRIGDKELVADVIRRVLAVERNFVLKKGETTAFSPPVTESDGIGSDLKALLDLARSLKAKPEGKKD